MQSKYLFISVLLLIFCVGAYGIEMSAPVLTAEKGAVVTAGISVDKAAGIAGGDITLEYDASIVSVKEVRVTDLAKPLSPLSNPNTAGKIKFAMAAVNPLKEGSGDLFQIDFVINADKGVSPLNLKDVSLYDVLGNDLSVTVKSGSITVVDKKPCTTPVVKEHTADSKILALQATYNEADVHGHAYVDIWKGEFTVVAGQFLEYQEAMFSGNPVFSGAVDLITADKKTLRDSGAKDQNGISAHPSADLSKFARDSWYHRKISLDTLAGKKITGAMIATDSDKHRAGLFRVYVDNIQLTDGECILLSIYKGEDNVPITGKPTASDTTFAGTAGTKDSSVSVVGATPVAPAGKLASTWGTIKKAQ